VIDKKRGWIIAIDGPSGAGKSTVAREIAKRLGYLYIDTGSMYRAIGMKAMQQNALLNDRKQIVEIAQTSRIELKNSEGRFQVFLDGTDVSEAIRMEPVSRAASIISSISDVRKVLVQAQQEMGLAGAVVMEGRDIGTKVFPNADLKVFLDASEITRAHRRFEQNRINGVGVSFHETMAEIHERDQRDRQRADSPLTQAADAVRIDTSEKTIAEVTQIILKLVDDLQNKQGR
jgi:CMP/dCMP kinase